MNANELAEIMDTFYRIEGKSLYNDIATMLRQQQVEIEALKKEQSELSHLCFEFGVLKR